jgi:hypothetical protein
VESREWLLTVAGGGLLQGLKAGGNDQHGVLFYNITMLHVNNRLQFSWAVRW